MSCLLGGGDRPDTSEMAKMLAQALGKPREGHVGLEEAGPILGRIETNGLIVYRTQDA